MVSHCNECKEPDCIQCYEFVLKPCQCMVILWESVELECTYCFKASKILTDTLACGCPAFYGCHCHVHETHK